MAPHRRPHRATVSTAPPPPPMRDPSSATTSLPVSGVLLKPLPFQSIDAYISVCGIQTTPVTPSGSCPSGVPAYGGQVTHPDQHGVAVVNQGNGATRLWIGNDGGVFRQDHAPGSSFAHGASP